MTRDILQVKFVIISLVLLTSLTACASIDQARRSISGAVKPSVSSQFDTKVADLLITRQPFNLFNPQAPQIVSASKNALPVLVNITPRSSFSGDTSSLYLAYFSKDRYYFGSVSIPAWTKQELQLVNPSERDVNKIRAAEQQRVKQVQIAFPLTDKDCKSPATLSR